MLRKIIKVRLLNYVVGVVVATTSLAAAPAYASTPTSSFQKVLPVVDDNGTTTSLMLGNGTVESSAAKPNGCTTAFGSCYYYVGAYQRRLRAGGVAVTISQAKPKIGRNDHHSLAEIALLSPNRKQAIEFGWTVDKPTFGDTRPRLFVFHWVNGKRTCYNGCGFVKLASRTPVGSAVTTGTTGRYEVNFTNHRWYVSYNGSRLGYYPASLWRGSFTKVSIVEAFGEVNASATLKPHTQMGNGKFGSRRGSTAFSRFQLVHSSTSAHLVLLPRSFAPKVGVYNHGGLSRTGIRFGGPGFK